MAHMVESMFFFGERPWHGLGVSVEGLLVAEDAIKKAGLDWRVVQPQVAYFDQDTNTWKVLDDYVLNLRRSKQKSKDKTPLGIVSKAYTVLQNEEAFTFMDQLVESGQLRYETAGSLKNGRVVWMLARLEDKELDVDGDKQKCYLVLRNSHDGSSMVRIYETAVRVVCWNTLQLSSQGAEGMGFTTQHTGDIMARVEEAKEALGYSTETFDEYEVNANKLIQFPLTTPQFNGFLDVAFLGTEEKHNEKKDAGRCKVFQIYQEGDPRLVGPRPGTAYAALQALTAYNTHLSHYDNGSDDQRSNRLGSNFFGDRASSSKRGYKFLVELAA